MYRTTKRLVTKYQSKGICCTLAATGRLFWPKYYVHDLPTNSFLLDTDKVLWTQKNHVYYFTVSSVQVNTKVLCHYIKHIKATAVYRSTSGQASLSLRTPCSRSEDGVLLTIDLEYDTVGGLLYIYFLTALLCQTTSALILYHTRCPLASTLARPWKQPTNPETILRG